MIKLLKHHQSIFRFCCYCLTSCNVWIATLLLSYANLYLNLWITFFCFILSRFNVMLNIYCGWTLNKLERSSFFISSVSLSNRKQLIFCGRLSLDKLNDKMEHKLKSRFLSEWEFNCVKDFILNTPLHLNKQTLRLGALRNCMNSQLNT